MNNTLTFFPFLNKYNSNNKKQPPKECADKDSIINNITVTTIFFLLFEAEEKLSPKDVAIISILLNEHKKINFHQYALKFP